MADLESNIDDVDAWIGRLVDGFDFSRPGRDGALGRDLAVAAARGIQERSVPDCLAPDGSIWLANEPRYARWKRARHDADQPGVRTGQMLSQTSLLGRTTVSADEVEMRYGTGQPPGSAANGAELAEGDRKTTDVRKAGFFTESGRAFYGLDETVAAKVRETAAEALDDYLA